METKGLSEKQQEGFYNKLNKRNARHARIIVIFALIMEAVMILYTLLRGRLQAKAVYVYLYVFMFVFSAASLFFLNPKRVESAHKKRALIGTDVVCFIAFLWGAAISYLDVKNGYNGSIVFLTLVFAVTGNVYIKPRNFVIICIVTFTAFLSAAYFCMRPSEFPGLVINHAVFFFVTVLFNRRRYGSLIKEYTREVNYQEMNNRLKELNESQKRTNDNLKKVSCTDALTGVSNRWGLHFVFARALEECRSNKQPLTVMMFDVDNFKSINDTMGHKAGDETLVKISKIFKSLAPEESVFRYGGEEFIVLLKDTEASKSIALAERIRSEVEKTSVGSRRLTISGGVYVKIPGIGSDSDEYLVGADKALYSAKAQGKNRVVLKSA